MSTPVFSNNVLTTLAAPITTTVATSITLSSAANLPTIGPGQFFALTLNDAATRQVFEIVYVTSYSGAVLNVQRGQEGTTAQTWLANDLAYGAVTAAELAQALTTGVQSLNGEGGAITIGSTANTVLVTEPSSGIINLEVNSNDVTTAVNGIRGAVVIQSPDNSLSVNDVGQDINIEWSPAFRSYGGHGITADDGSGRYVLSVTVPYVIVAASGTVAQNFGSTNDDIVFIAQDISNFADGLVVFYGVNGSTVLNGLGIYYTVTTNNTPV